ncbi:hypothetical protein [Pseudobutyrivibrio sp.]|uniref:hypothetical protein n=1 Tax=Pseudobutyrivibrio sp. TaxID=2014367 RepID=UPI00386E6B57
MWDRFVFAVVSATIVAFTLTHWIPYVAYKYEDGLFLIIDVKVVVWIASISCVYYLIRKGRIEFDYTLFLLCTAMLLVAVIDYHNEDYEPIKYALVLPLSYMLGKLIIGTEKEDANKKIITLYAVMAVPMFIQSTLDFGVNWYYDWALGTERWMEFWTGEVDARTTYEMGFVLTTSALGVAILRFKKHKALSILIFIAITLSEYLIIHAEGRQNPVMMVISIFLVMCMYTYDNWSSDNKKLKLTVFIIVAIGIIALAALVIMFATNAFGVMDIYKNSYWASGGFLKNERFAINWRGFKNMLKYPLEDYQKVAGLPRPHSLVLEYGRVYDITIYALLTLVRLSFIVQAVRLALNKNKYSMIKYLLFPGFVCINLYYTMEPNGYAHRYMWMPGLIISGMISGWLELNKNQQISFDEVKIAIKAKLVEGGTRGK